MEQLILNLAINARDAMPDGGTLTISTRIAELDEAYAAQHPGVAPGAYVAIEIADSGTGMPPERARAHLRAVLHDQSLREKAPVSA